MGRMFCLFSVWHDFHSDLRILRRLYSGGYLPGWNAFFEYDQGLAVDPLEVLKPVVADEGKGFVEGAPERIQ